MYFRTEELEVKPFSPEDRDPMIDLLTDATVKQTSMVPDFPARLLQWSC